MNWALEPNSSSGLLHGLRAQGIMDQNWSSQDTIQHLFADFAMLELWAERLVEWAKRAGVDGRPCKQMAWHRQRPGGMGVQAACVRRSDVMACQGKDADCGHPSVFLASVERTNEHGTLSRQPSGLDKQRNCCLLAKLWFKALFTFPASQQPHKSSKRPNHTLKRPCSSRHSSATLPFPLAL